MKKDALSFQKILSILNFHSRRNKYHVDNNLDNSKAFETFEMACITISSLRVFRPFKLVLYFFLPVITTLCLFIP